MMLLQAYEKSDLWRKEYEVRVASMKQQGVSSQEKQQGVSPQEKQ